MAGINNNWQEGERNYRAFLLRCWQEGQLPNEEEPRAALAWRFALVPIDDEPGAKGFACLEDLFAYLGAELKAETSNYLSARKGGNI
jgi:hypothetical protein